MPIEQHPTFGAALRGAPGAGFAPAVPAHRAPPAKGHGKQIAIAVGAVVLLALVGVGVRYMKWKNAQDDKEDTKPAGKPLSRKEAKKRADAFEVTLATIKKIDPASAPSIESDGYTVKGVRPAFVDSDDSSEDNDDLVVHAEDLKQETLLAEVAYRASGTKGLWGCNAMISGFKKSKEDDRSEDFLKGCTKIKYLWVIRIRNVVKPTITDVKTEGNTRTHAFEKGSIDGDVVGFDLKSGQPIGGFRFAAVSSETPPDPSSRTSPQEVLDEDLRSRLTTALNEASSKAWKP
jgi:hypothetical protein